MPTTVLLIGLQSSSVDLSKWPELSREKLESAFRQVSDALRDGGFEPIWCLVDSGETAARVVAQKLEEHAPDVVSIGAGVRADPDHLRLFEELVNVAHAKAPQARFAFNTDPLDTIESVKRAAAR